MNVCRHEQDEISVQFGGNVRKCVGIAMVFAGTAIGKRLFDRLRGRTTGGEKGNQTVLLLADGLCATVLIAVGVATGKLKKWTFDRKSRTLRKETQAIWNFQTFSETKEIFPFEDIESVGVHHSSAHHVGVPGIGTENIGIKLRHPPMFVPMDFGRMTEFLFLPIPGRHERVKQVSYQLHILFTIFANCTPNPTQRKRIQSFWHSFCDAKTKVFDLSVLRARLKSTHVCEKRKKKVEKFLSLMAILFDIDCDGKISPTEFEAIILYSWRNENAVSDSDVIAFDDYFGKIQKSDFAVLQT